MGIQKLFQTKLVDLNYKVVGYIDEMKKVGSKVNKFLKANILGKLDDLKK